MADSSVVLNLGAGGDSLDAESVGGVKRERVQIGGASLAEILRVKNSVALYNDYAACVRQVPSTNSAGAYYASSTVQSVQASAQNATSTGFFWLQNPTANTKQMRLWYLAIQLGMGAAAIDMLSGPRINLNRFTFTGTASGATLTPGKRKTTDAANSGDVRTAVTGMTVSLGAAMHTTLVPMIDSLTVSGVFTYRKEFIYQPRVEGEVIDLAPGEGLVLYQPDAGTTGDIRRFTYTLDWDEYTP